MSSNLGTTFQGFDSMRPGNFSMMKSAQPSQDWTRFSTECIEKISRKVMEMYNRSNTGNLSNFEVGNMLKDVYSSSKTLRTIDQGEIQDFKNYHDKNKDGQ